MVTMLKAINDDEDDVVVDGDDDDKGITMTTMMINMVGAGALSLLLL